MGNFRLFGLEAGSASVSAQQADNSASGSGMASGSTGDASDPTAFTGRSASTIWEGLGAASAGDHGITWSPRLVPMVFGDHYRVTDVSGDRILSSDFSDSEFRAARVIGGTARIYRISNGEMALVRESTIVGGNWGKWIRITSSDSKGATSGFQFRFAGFSRSGGSYEFGVAALDGSNRIGAIGSTSYVPADLSGNSASNSETSLGSGFLTGGALAAPANVTATADPSGNGLVTLTWDPVPGATAYMPFISYNESAASVPSVPYLDLANDGGAAVQLDDLLIVSAAARVPTMDMVSQRAWGAGSVLTKLDSLFSASLMAQQASWMSYEYKAFDAGFVSPDTTQTSSDYVEVNIAADRGLTTLVERQWHANSVQSYYHVVDPTHTYRFEVWVWADRAASGALAFRFDNQDRVGLGPESVDLSAGWQKLVFSKQPSAALSPSQTSVGYWQIRVTTSGAGALQLRMAGARMHVEGVEFEGAEDTSHWPIGSEIRTDAMVKKAPLAPTFDQLSGPAGQSCIGYTLNGQISAIHAGGNVPHIQLEWYHSDAEFQDFVAFIAAPVSSGHPMALRRASLGRTAPWVDEWDRFYFELSNEAWNVIAEFWTAPYELKDSVTSQVYSHGEGFGIIFRRIALAMMASPYWTDKIRFVVGSQPNQAFGPDAASTFKFPVEVGPSLYMSGWDVDNGLPQQSDPGYQSVLAAPMLVMKPPIESNVTRLKDVAAASGGIYTYGENLLPMSYESGPGYQLNGLNGASVSPAQAIQQEVVLKSRACATGTLDAFLTQAKHGFSRSIFFTMGRGDLWSARAPDSDGGHVYVTWQVVKQMQDRVGRARPDLVRNISISEISVTNSSGGSTDIDSLYLHTMRSLTYPGRVVIAVGNRSLTTTYKPTICTPFLSATGCKVIANTGDMREYNRYAPGKRPAPTIRVDGAGQSGSSLAIDGLARLPELGDTFTIAGVAGTYTVNDVSGWDQTSGTVGLSTSLSSSPASNAIVTWGDVVDGFHSDSLCVDITLSEQAVPVPSNLSRIIVDDALGAGSTGIAPGNCVLIQLDGVT